MRRRFTGNGALLMSDFEFGQNKPRSLDTFGISGLLGPEVEVFYNTIFSTRHLGRVSDLLCARLRKSKIDELKLRTVLIFGLFEAYRGQYKKKGFRLFSKSDSDSLEDPFILECGIDNEKLVLGVMFNLNSTVKLEGEGLADRVSQRQAGNPFEEILVDLQNQADRVIIKFQPQTRRIEISLFVAIPGRIKESNVRVPMTFLLLDREQIPVAPRPRKYTNLGDLNYPLLLQESAKDRDHYFSPTGEFLMPAESNSLPQAVVPTLNTTVASSGDGLLGESRQRRDVLVAETARMVGGGDVKAEPMTTIGGANQDLANQDVIVISGGDEPTVGRAWGQGRVGKAFKNAAKSFRNLFNRQVLDDDVDSSSTDAGLNGDFEVSSEKRAGKRSAPTEIDTGDYAKGSETVESEDFPSDDNRIDLSNPNAKLDDPEAEAKKLATEIKSGGLDGVIKRMQGEMFSIKKDITNPKTRKWMDDLVAKLVAERGKLTELSRKVNLSVRLKTMELKSKNVVLQEELKRADAQLFQKNKALAKNQETLDETIKAMETLKFKAEQIGDQVQMRQKYQLTQKMLVLSKEENAQLSKRVDELKAQVDGQAGKAGEGISAEHAALQEKYEKLFRQAEELKKSSRQRERGDTAAAESEDKTRRLETAMKLIAASRRETADARAQAASLSAQIAKLQEELKKGTKAA
jgi:hypothetical protein